MRNNCSWCGGPAFSEYPYATPQAPHETDDGSWWCGWCVDKYLSNCDTREEIE